MHHSMHTSKDLALLVAQFRTQTFNNVILPSIGGIWKSIGNWIIDNKESMRMWERSTWTMTIVLIGLGTLHHHQSALIDKVRSTRMKDNEVNKIQGELQGDPMRLTPKLWETWINFSLYSLRIHSYIYKLLKIWAILVLCVLMCNGSRGPIILCIFFFIIFKIVLQPSLILAEFM